MPFINELIPEADKARIDWSKFRAWPFSDPHDPWKWTIDRENDVFFIGLETGRWSEHQPSTFALSWKGHVVRIEAEDRGVGEFTTGVDMFWTISKVEIPPELRTHKEEVLDILRKAVDAYGSTYRREQVKSVHIDIVDSTGIAK